ncbi:lipase [Gordonia phage Lambo]|uniref:Lipase n=1 Tax=Gordonia phage Lambo TaxID=2599845 RepID=A0A5J6TRX9_9CAUD|nr:tail fiber protein [Gordonia phage Lambo]QFG13516.1 lipase [Gordonia phage Lambo]
MANVWYIGDAQERILKFGSQEFTWNKWNGWSINENAFTSQQLLALDADPGFLLNQDGPRVAPPWTPDSRVGPESVYLAEVRKVHDAVIGRQRFDVMSGVRHRLATNQDTVWTHLGDSTANADDEWLKLMMNQFRNDYPSMKVTHELWNDTSKSYDAPVTHQAGGALVPTPQTMVLNTSNQAYNARDDNGGVQSILDFSWPQRTTGDPNTGSRIHLLSKNTAVAGVFAESSVNDASVTLSLYKRIGGTATALGTGVSITRDNLASGGSGRLILEVDGLNVTATLIVGGQSTTRTGTLLASDITEIGADRHYGQLSLGSNHTHTSWTIGSAPNNASIGKFRIVNGSMPGASLTYLNTNLNAMTPVDSHVLTVATSHNHSHLETPEQYIMNLDTFIKKAKARMPSAVVIVSSQNPKWSPQTETSIQAHRARLLALDDYTRKNGYGYIPAFEQFDSRTDRGKNWMNSDGIHPIQVGSEAWATAALKVFRGVAPF